MVNYPDDIRQYDDDPRSPFYDGKQERFIEYLTQEIAIDPDVMVEVLADSNERYGNIVSILCDIYEKRSSGNDCEEQMMQFMYAWSELAQAVAHGE